MRSEKDRRSILLMDDIPQVCMYIVQIVHTVRVFIPKNGTSSYYFLRVIISPLTTIGPFIYSGLKITCLYLLN